MGQTYALPTKDHRLNTLPLSDIKIYVDRFIQFAKDNPDKRFLVTEVGCGLAGYKAYEIAPLFIEASEVDNIFLPAIFWLVIITE